MYLTGVYLTGVHLTGVCLTGVYLTGVHLMGVYLTGVHLMGVHLTDVPHGRVPHRHAALIWHTPYRRASWTGAQPLQSMHLRVSDFLGFLGKPPRRPVFVTETLVTMISPVIVFLLFILL